jgi:Domain of Unknown Function (DUF1521)
MSTTLTAQTTTTTLSLTSGDGGAAKAAQGPSTTRGADGNVNFENKNYTVKVGDTGEINITNKQTGETYKVWGDPHVDIDGKHAFDFKGTTTFDLDDGTKITIDTTPWKGENGATIASKVTIVDGQSDYAVQMNGVDDNKTGDLTFNETSKGWLMDAMVDDGNVMHENPAGKGFVAVDDRGNMQKVDQKWVDKAEAKDTEKGSGDAKLDKELKQMVEKFTKLISIFTGIMAIRFLGTMMSNLGNSGEQNGGNSGPKNAPSNGNQGNNFTWSPSITNVTINNNYYGDNNSNNRTVDYTMSRNRDASFELPLPPLPSARVLDPLGFFS